MLQITKQLSSIRMMMGKSIFVLVVVSIGGGQSGARMVKIHHFLKTSFMIYYSSIVRYPNFSAASTFLAVIQKGSHSFDEQRPQQHNATPPPKPIS